MPLVTHEEMLGENLRGEVRPLAAQGEMFGFGVWAHPFLNQLAPPPFRVLSFDDFLVSKGAALGCWGRRRAR